MLSKCWHNWSKWKDTETEVTTDVTILSTNTKYQTGKYLVQVKECKDCGIKKLRREKI